MAHLHGHLRRQNGTFCFAAGVKSGLKIELLAHSNVDGQNKTGILRSDTMPIARFWECALWLVKSTIIIVFLFKGLGLVL